MKKEKKWNERNLIYPLAYQTLNLISHLETHITFDGRNTEVTPKVNPKIPPMQIK